MRINAVRRVRSCDLLSIPRRYSSVGFQYSYDLIPTADALAAMLEKSPIVHAAQVRLAQIKKTEACCFSEILVKTNSYSCYGKM